LINVPYTISYNNIENYIRSKINNRWYFKQVIN
jgi:hypothetical protein